MAGNPLREAREVLMLIRSLAEVRDANSGGRLARIALAANATLARLDALPAPKRAVKGGFLPPGWFYPDAPSDGGEDA